MRANIGTRIPACIDRSGIGRWAVRNTASKENRTDESVKAARQAGLRYVSDRAPGIRRIGTGKTFRYIQSDGRIVRNPETLGRIRALAIPPAWTDVWICPNPEGHIQAIGRDARKRKQYRYHARWRQVRDETKYHRMIAFGKVLPKIRARVQRDLRSKELTREKVLATIVRLLEATLIRVGNEEYSKQNHSFGLTTLRDHHVNISGQTVSFYFRGKSGVKHAISVEDANLAKIVKRCRDLPGYELFRYYDDKGEIHSVDSIDVNEYLRGVANDDFTAKDFRTWAGTVLAAGALCGLDPFSSNTEAKRNVKKAVESVAEKLGNTVAVCRKCYIHPDVIDAYLNRSLTDRLKTDIPRGRLRAEEAAVLRFLERGAKAKPHPTLEQSLAKSVRMLSKQKRHG